MPQLLVINEQARKLHEELLEVDRQRTATARAIQRRSGPKPSVWDGAGVWLASQQLSNPEELEANRKKLEALVLRHATLRKEIEDLQKMASKVDLLASEKKLRTGIEGVAQEITDSLDASLQAMGALERKAHDYARAQGDVNEVMKQRLADLKEEGRLADERLKQMAINKQFSEELQRIAEQHMTRGLSIDDQRLAGLVSAGFSNEQIMRLREAQASLQEAMRRSTFSAGGFASESMARQFGVASHWRKAEKLAELNNDLLNGIRGELEDLKRRMAFGK